MFSCPELELYPLAPQWKLKECFEDVLHLGPLSMVYVGLVAEHLERGEQVVAAATETHQPPRSRAYFELLERVSILDYRHQNPHYVGQSHSPEPKLWNYARSNGVALHTLEPEADRRAFLELVERDRILRSWCGEFTPTRIEWDGHPFYSLRNWIEIKTYFFQDPLDPYPNVHVAAVFGYPYDPARPIVCGYGAGESPHEAASKAASECLQRLSFLWEEEANDELPAFSATPDFHQEVFLRPQSRERLENWLQGGHQEVKAEQPTEPYNQDRRALSFVDLSPAHLQGKIFVKQALSPHRVPLTFGQRAPFCHPKLPRELWIHPLM